MIAFRSIFLTTKIHNFPNNIMCYMASILEIKLSYTPPKQMLQSIRQHVQGKNFTIPWNTHAYYTQAIIPLRSSSKIYVYSIIPSNIFIIHSDSKTVLKLHVIQRKVHHFHHKRQTQHMFQISLFIFESKIRKRTTKINPPFFSLLNILHRILIIIFMNKKSEEENEEKRS